MHYVALMDGDEHPVEVTQLAGGRYQVQLGDERFELDVVPTSDDSLSCLVEGRVYNVDFEERADGTQGVLVQGHPLRLEVLDLRRMQLRKAQIAAAGPKGPVPVTSPMPGKVVAVLVSEGDEVIEGQGLVVVEAMKMENELKAPRDGVVKKLAVSEGDAVEGAAALCVVE